jgi:hypothetical protein
MCAWTPLKICPVSKVNIYEHDFVEFIGHFYTKQTTNKSHKATVVQQKDYETPEATRAATGKHLLFRSQEIITNCQFYGGRIIETINSMKLC